MKTVSPALATHLAGAVTTLATCWRISRTDGVVFRFTDHDQDLVFEGEVYQASSGYSRTAIANDAGMGVDNLHVEGVFDSESVTEEELRAGLFDQAEVRIFLVNWADPSMGALRLRRGWFGEVVLTESGVFKTELRGLTQALQQRIGELYSPECRADLGDHRCRVPIHLAEVQRETAYAIGDHVRVATGTGSGSQVYQNRLYRCVVAGTTAAVAPAYDTMLGAQTPDGSAVFEAQEAWSRSGTVVDAIDRARFTAVIDEPRAVDGWFGGGVLTWESGANAGRSIEVKRWMQTTGEVELVLPMHHTIGALWMISAVARIFRPGVKADHMLILEGPQGARKSTALKVLAGEAWFTDELRELGSKDAAIQLQRVWIVEVAELDAIGRAEVSRIKAFVTRTTDRFRPPYGRHTVELPRQCVFAGTVNPDTYRRDETGNRRFWPLRCGTIDIAALARDRDQLWAEAVARYKQGAIWWLDDPTLIAAIGEAQQERFQADAWDARIDRWLTHERTRVNHGSAGFDDWREAEIERTTPLADVSVGEVLEQAIGIEPARWTKGDQMRVGAYLKASGWERHRARLAHGLEWRYRR